MSFSPVGRSRPLSFSVTSVPPWLKKPFLCVAVKHPRSGFAPWNRPVNPASS